MEKKQVYLIAGGVAILLVGVGFLVFGGGLHGMTNPAHTRDQGGSADGGAGTAGTQDGAVIIHSPGIKQQYDWEKIRGQVTVNVTASGDVATVEFYLTDERIHTEEERPFDWTFDTTQTQDCMYKFRAVAYNAAGEKIGEDRTNIWTDNTDGNCM
ncbi:MAG: Ig-like domain-containing protein [Candidatus Nanohaloarchaea archaeon]|nr:Ig-like domain-containing protein [Candidatus Nanohaloarchaea archaeon]